MSHGAALKRNLLILARPHIVFYVLAWLMVLLIAGTVAQKYIGLYWAQNIFFTSWIIWLGILPLPGGLLTLLVLTASLTAKLFLASRWRWNNAGTIITHLGALLLLWGGLITYLHAQEGSMVIYEGESADYFSDYHARELAIVESENGHAIISFPWEELKQGRVLSIPGLPVRLEIIKHCRNCNIFQRSVPENDPSLKEFQGMARKLDIAPLPPEKQDEDNRGAVQFRVSGAGDKDGIHFSADFIDASPSIQVNGKTYNIALRHKRTQLPFKISLVDFEKITYPGTDKPKSYRSEIILKENGLEWRSLIQMNEPLRYRGYTFYQSSFIDDGKKQATVLAVVKNAGRLFPYISSIVMCIGLLIHVVMSLPGLIRSRRPANIARPIIFVGFLTCVLAGFAPQARSADYDFKDFSRVPVLDQGRVKPLDTLARSYLEIIYGKESMPGMSAIAWLAEALMDPDKSYERQIFNISNPDIVAALELEKRKGHRYSYRELTDALLKHEKTWKPLFGVPEEKLSLQQKQLAEIFYRTQLFAELSRSLSLLFPEFTVPQGALAEELSVEPGTKVNFFRLEPHQALIEKISRDLIKKRKSKKYRQTAEDKALEALVVHSEEINRDRSSNIFKVIPPQWGFSSGSENSKTWFSPWGIGVDGQGSPDAAKFLNMWNELIDDYRAGRHAELKETSKKILDFSLQMAGENTSSEILSLEVAFNHVQPFKVSFIFYVLALLVIMGGFIALPERARQISLAMVVLGLLFHGLGIGTRMYIMQRPPVTSLYESIIFVALVSVVFGIILERRLRNTLGIIIASSMGTFLQFIGMKFNAEGDTMGMLEAVLNTNFWLATHVVTITIGYGCCLVGGVLGHVYLIRRILDPGDTKTLTEIYCSMRGVVFVALLFASVGTILGGIWADQSWGRFWGWDPKENGALLIVLWLVFLIHGRLSGLVRELGFAVGMVLTNVVVAMAWFGVNLLGVGLHSYGFTQGAATSFVTFCTVEILFAAGSYTLIKLRHGNGATL